MAAVGALAGCGAGGAADPNPGGVVFNTGSGDVTLFDPVRAQGRGTHGFDATVRWLSDTQRFWDGRRIWTYDYPGNDVQAIAVTPGSWQVGTRIPVGARGPAHSLVLTPDLRTAYVSAAGSDVIGVVDTTRSEVVGHIRTGAYP